MPVNSRMRNEYVCDGNHFNPTYALRRARGATAFHHQTCADIGATRWSSPPCTLGKSAPSRQPCIARRLVSIDIMFNK